MENLSQNEMIENYLLNGGKITALEALNKFRCFRLASRITDLKKKGLPIQSAFISVDSGKKVKQYWINGANN
jgi:hypothetical protein